MRLRPAQHRLPAAALAAFVTVAGCQRQQPSPPTPAPPAVEAPAPQPRAPAVVARDGLLDALDVAASAYAAGQTSDATLAGRRFAIRQAFGCGGSSSVAAPGLARWAWGPDRRTLEITLTPADWTRDAIFGGVQARPWEAVEGFWIARPWARSAGCPASVASAAAPAVVEKITKVDEPPARSEVPAARPSPERDPQVAGLAAVFAHDGSRLGRRDGRPFTLTVRPDGATPLAGPTRGYRLVIEGRLVAFPEGGVIRCRAPTSDVRPVCIAAAEVDRVAFEDADGRLLRDWRPG